jgi:phenylacetate-CoA ligase
MYSTFFRCLRQFYRGGLERHRFLKELEYSQWLSKEEMEAQKLAQLKKLFKHAYENVPFYHDLYVNMDIHPKDINSFSDFQALPYLTKETVVEHLPELISTNFDKDNLFPQQTGGSTGLPMPFYIDRSFWHRASALAERNRRWYGVYEGDKVALVWGNEGNDRDDTLRTYIRSRIIRRRYLNALHLTPSNMQSFAEKMVNWKPDMFVAYTTAMVFFAQHLQKNNIHGIRPRLIELTGEKVSPSQRILLEDVFGCPVVDCYSSREMSQIAYQCPEGNIHICETNYLELVSDNKPVHPGEIGEVVLTNLHHFAMPLIRYKMTDLAIASTSVCHCGRALPVLQKIVGRTSDAILTGNGEFIDEAFFEFILMGMPQIARYQIYQPNLEHLQVNLVLRQPVNTIWINALQQRIQEPFGPSVQIKLQIVDEIDQTATGKFRVVRSDVKSGLIQ